MVIKVVQLFFIFLPHVYNLCKNADRSLSMMTGLSTLYAIKEVYYYFIDEYQLFEITTLWQEI